MAFASVHLDRTAESTSPPFRGLGVRREAARPRLDGTQPRWAATVGSGVTATVVAARV